MIVIDEVERGIDFAKTPNAVSVHLHQRNQHLSARSASHHLQQTCFYIFQQVSRAVLPLTQSNQQLKSMTENRNHRSWRCPSYRTASGLWCATAAINPSLQYTSLSLYKYRIVRNSQLYVQVLSNVYSRHDCLLTWA